MLMYNNLTVLSSSVCLCVKLISSVLSIHQNKITTGKTRIKLTKANKTSMKYTLSNSDKNLYNECYVVQTCKFMYTF